MKKTPLRRNLEKLRAWLTRRKPLPKVNRARKAKRYARDFGSYAEIIRGMNCDICEAPPPSDPSHARSRGSGGDKRSLVPMCRACHNAYHDGKGISRDHARNRAAVYWALYGEENGA